MGGIAIDSNTFQRPTRTKIIQFKAQPNAATNGTDDGIANANIALYPRRSSQPSLAIHRHAMPSSSAAVADALRSLVIYRPLHFPIETAAMILTKRIEQ